MGLCLSAPPPANAENDTELKHFHQELAAEAAAVLRAMDSSDSSDDGSHVANEESDAVEAELAVTSPLLRPDRADQKYKEVIDDAVAACADYTAGQICYICKEAVTEETNEGLVSGFCACRGDLSFAHVSCLARQAQVVAERTFDRWHTCRQCEQEYHGVVSCALGWACWKTYVGRPEADPARGMAMTLLGNGLSSAQRHEDALSVRLADLATRRRIGADSEENMLIVQGNLAGSYGHLGRHEQALRVWKEVYSGRLELNGVEHENTLMAANNYASSFISLERFEEAWSLLRKTIAVARRVLGENHELTLKTRVIYVMTRYADNNATLDDLREAATMLEELERTARRVFGGEHPLTSHIEISLRAMGAVLATQETPPPPPGNA